MEYRVRERKIESPLDEERQFFARGHTSHGPFFLVRGHLRPTPAATAGILSRRFAAPLLRGVVCASLKFADCARDKDSGARCAYASNQTVTERGCQTETQLIAENSEKSSRVKRATRDVYAKHLFVYISFLASSLSLCTTLCYRFAVESRIHKDSSKNT